MRAAGALGAATAAVVVLAFASGAAAAPLQIGFADPLFSSANDNTRALWLDRARKARAKIVRIPVSWRVIAPDVEPADPTDPSAYDWGAIPAGVDDANARGLKVLLTVTSAPDWAEAPGRPAGVHAGTWKPNAEKFGQFGRALAAKFAGDVRHYQAWNEPNIYPFLMPQYEGNRLVAPDIYRRLLNSFYEGVHEVQRNAVVVSGGTAPYGDPPGGRRTRPLLFLRKLLCLRSRTRLKPTKCPEKAKLDALAHHPINTAGGPYQRSRHRDSVTTSDIKYLVRTLRKAERTHRLRPRGHRPVWLTEFWWQTNPPDVCAGIPVRKHARWISRALRAFKRQGASVAINFLIRDEPYLQKSCGGPTFQTGAFFANGKRKPAFRSFRRFARR
jgi:Cellulase (glycosyl hydrolase family 5)